MLRKFSDIKHAIYINLDSRNDRRELFEKQFEELTALYPEDFKFTPVPRFSAIKDEENGAMSGMSFYFPVITTRLLKLRLLIVFE